MCFFDVCGEQDYGEPWLFTYTGQLDGVHNLKRLTTSEHLQYTWDPPYSLDLTMVVPDIIYCLDILRVTCGIREHIISDCHVTHHNYTNETLDVADLYEAIVTPRSNIMHANNGTQVSIFGM